MIKKIEIGGLHCLCAINGSKESIAYVLYPMEILADWIEPAAEKYGTTIVVITGMDWQNVFSPWPAPGVPKGTADFEGKSPEFLKLLQQTVIPVVENALGLSDKVERSLVGVSMSGLFALWQWMICDTFSNIASLSGSFWYEGFMEWMKEHTVPSKTGKGYFLLGDQESKSKVKEFDSVGVNTREIIEMLRKAGVNVEFRSVPGNHYSDPIPRINKAFTDLFNQ